VSPSLKNALEWSVQLVIIFSLAAYFAELELIRAQIVPEGYPLFIWSERFITLFFTVEYFVRWRASRDWKYPCRLLALIDLFAVLPFYLGFMMDMRALRVIRTLRILSLLKFYRYHQALQRIVLSFQRAIPNLVAVGFIVLIFVLYSSTFVYEMERSAQRDKFASVLDAAWWSIVTMTTVGYGDLYPTTASGRLVGVTTIVFGVAVFSLFFSVLQEAFAGASDSSNEDILAKLDRQNKLLIAIAARLGVDLDEVDITGISPVSCDVSAEPADTVPALRQPAAD